jgi:uncharacterized protein YndB with AHSA1/START domain
MPTESTDIYEDAIVRRTDFAASPDRVWKAITDSGEFGRWFRVALDGPFTAGKVVTGKMTYPGYEGMPFEAEIVAVEPKTRFAYRWVPGECGVKDKADGETLVEFVLEPVGSGTRLTVRESGFSALSEHKRFEVMRSNSQGWDAQVENLRRHVGG